jgi:hypothetical protein
MFSRVTRFGFCIRALLQSCRTGPKTVLGFRVCVRTRFLEGTGLGGGKESQVTRRNQSRRDGTICSPARECRVGFHTNRVPKGTTQWGSHANSLAPAVFSWPTSATGREKLLSNLVFRAGLATAGAKARILLVCSHNKAKHMNWRGFSSRNLYA